MSCLGPEYNPIPPREWNRFQPRCPVNISGVEGLDMYRKANILQYKKNSANLTKKQIYALLAQRYFVSYASQTQEYSYPNIYSLKRINTTDIVAPQSSNIIDSYNITKFEYLDCIKKPAYIVPTDLPAIADQGPPPIPIPPQPDIKPDYPAFPPIVHEVGKIVYLIKNGGTLVCNTIENPCTGEILKKTENLNFYPTTCSNVPGPIKELYWSGRLPTYYPKTIRTYGTSGDKWPVNSKLIRPIYPFTPLKI